MKIKTVHPEEYKVAVKLQNLYLKTLILLKTTSIIKNKEMKTSYPIEYKTIPTQYSFLVSKENGKYRVQTQILTKPQDKYFETEQEARKFISSLKEIL